MANQHRPQSHRGRRPPPTRYAELTTHKPCCPWLDDGHGHVRNRAFFGGGLLECLTAVFGGRRPRRRERTANELTLLLVECHTIVVLLHLFDHVGKA